MIVQPLGTSYSAQHWASGATTTSCAWNSTAGAATDLSVWQILGVFPGAARWSPSSFTPVEQLHHLPELPAFSATYAVIGGVPG